MARAICVDLKTPCDLRRILRPFLAKNQKKISESSDVTARPMINLQRFSYDPRGTLALLTVQGERFYTIERPWVNNERGISCIPEGEYELAWIKSPRFGWCYQVKDVTNRSHILIHVANYATDVTGCVGLGMSLMGDRIAVANSRKAMKKFHRIMDKKPCRIKVEFASLAEQKNP